MFEISYEKITLSNGLDVIFHENDSLPTVAVNVWYHVGSKNEVVGQTGFAHLFEHMMFEGSKNHNRNYFEPIQEIGGVLNGSTTADRTNYWETVPANHLGLALWLESDRMGFLLDALDQERFDVQRDIVKNERRQSYENRPYGMADLRIQELLFPPPHPYNWPVIGSQEDLDAASLDDVRDFFRKFYSPSNASLAISGDFNRVDAEDMIRLYFNDIKPGPEIEHMTRMDSSLSGETRLAITDRIQLPRLSLVWPSVPIFDNSEPPLDILATILGDGKSSRLHSEMVYEKQVARQVRVGHFSREISGEFSIEVTASPSHTLLESQQLIESAIYEIQQKPPSQRELDRAINRIESDHVKYLELSGGFGGIADQLNHFNVFNGNPSSINTYLDQYRAVSPEDISVAARRFLSLNRVNLSVLPEKEKSTSISTVDRSIMPLSTNTKTFNPPVPQRYKMANGLNILYLKKSEVPLVVTSVIFPTGGILDPLGKDGLSNLTATTLVEGTTNRTSQQISREIEFLGTHINTYPGKENLIFSSEILTVHTSELLEIFSDIITNPTFPEREVGRVKKERAADLKRMSDDPVYIANRASRSLICGVGSKYGKPLLGTTDSIENITRRDLYKHFENEYGPTGATLILVGDLKEKDIVPIADRYFGNWNSSASTSETFDQISGNKLKPTTVYLCDKPGAAQSVIKAGHLTINRHDPNYYAVTLLNYMFGGHAMARLFLNLRQDKGYSYGYYSSIDWYKESSLILAGGSVQTGVTKEAVVETIKEFSDLKGGRPISQEELETAKNGIVRGFPSRFETQGQIASQLGLLASFQLDDDYYSHLLENITAITLDEINKVASEQIYDQNLTIVVVGDRAIVERELQDLDCPLVPIDAHGNLIE